VAYPSPPNAAPAVTVRAEAIPNSTSGGAVSVPKPVPQSTPGASAQGQQQISFNGGVSGVGGTFNELLNKPRSAEDIRMDELGVKLHPSLMAIIRRIRAKQAESGPGEDKFVHDSKAELQVWLTEKSTEAMTKLKEMGFEVVLDQKTSKLVIGRLSIEKLEQLADLKFVRYVSPQTSN